MGGNDGGRVRDVWSSPDGITWSQHTTPGWSGREDAAAVVHKGTIYVLGGETGSSAANSQVWASTDGESWNSVGDAGWSGRWGHGAVVHNDKIYVMGGRLISTFHRDVWEWTGSGAWNKVGDAQWSRRNLLSALSYKGLLYVIGGLTLNNGQVGTNDVWSSSDGQSWNSVSGTKFLPVRSAHQAVIFP